MKLSFHNLINKYQKENSFWFLLLFLFCFLLISPTLLFGIPNGFDLAFHYQLAFSYFESIQSLNFFPSWSLSSNNGFGDTAIRYYSPLAHYLLAFTQLITKDWYITSSINIFFWMFLGSIGAYLLAKEFLSNSNSFWVAILYTIAPYHLSQIYQYFLFSEYAAAAILPFCFLYLTKAFKNNDFKNYLYLSISFSFLLVCHIPSTIISTICLGIYSLFLLDWRKFPIVFRNLLISGFIILSATAFYWSKLVTETDFTNQSNIKQFTGLYFYKLHFFPFFFSQPDLYFVKQLWLRDIISILTIFFLLPLFTSICLKGRNYFQIVNKQLTALSITALFAFFMSSSLSQIIWSNLPFLQKLQFPFRWLTVVSLLGSLIFVIAINKFQFKKNFSKLIGKYSIIFFLTALCLFDISQIVLPSEMLNRESFEKKLNELENEEVLAATKTIWAKNEVFTLIERVTASNRTVQIEIWNAEKRVFKVESGSETNAEVSTFYYPFWLAKANNKPIQIGKSENGNILLTIPPDKTLIELEFIEPLSLQIAKFISFFSWLIIGITLITFVCKNFFIEKSFQTN